MGLQHYKQITTLLLTQTDWELRYTHLPRCKTNMQGKHIQAIMTKLLIYHQKRIFLFISIAFLIKNLGIFGNSRLKHLFNTVIKQSFQLGLRIMFLPISSYFKINLSRLEVYINPFYQSHTYLLFLSCKVKYYQYYVHHGSE